MTAVSTHPPLPTTGTPINSAVVNPFLESVRAVLQTMVKVSTVVGVPHIKSDPVPQYDISGVIGFSGDVAGSVVVSLQLASAKELVAAFAGAPIDPGSPDFADAVGELVNMIAGGAKKHLGKAAGITVPSVVMGSGHTIARLSDVPTVVIPCRTPGGAFAVEVNIRQIKA